jgi:hypothetical protein
MKTTSIAFALSALLWAGACSNDQKTATNQVAPAETAAVQRQASAEMTPEQLGELGAEITQRPNEAEQLLAQRGLDAQSFERAIRKVAEDPTAARKYAESYKKSRA